MIRFRDAALRLGAALLAAGSCAAATAAEDPQPARAGAAAPAAQELQLDTTSITGSRELPTVLNILPWKRPPAQELRGQPEDSLLDEVLQPVNRVEFRRELRYQAGPPPP